MRPFPDSYRSNTIPFPQTRNYTPPLTNSTSSGPIYPLTNPGIVPTSQPKRETPTNPPLSPSPGTLSGSSSKVEPILAPPSLLQSTKVPFPQTGGSSSLKEQSYLLLREVGPALMKEFGPPIARRIGPPLIRRLGPPLVQNVGLPLAKKVGIPLAKKVAIPLVKKFGGFLLHRIGL